MYKRALSSILVTGGCGFIGSNLIRYFLKEKRYDGRIVNLDALTYAGNINNLSEVIELADEERYTFIRGDINDRDLVDKTIKDYNVDTIIHFAAESHVDRSIIGPGNFVRTNILGTFTLLEAARNAWNDRDDVLFHHISTDEVYGSIDDGKYFTENSPYNPRSPYSASKAGSDHLVSSYYHTYALPVTISNCSNNYGPYQFPEKLIPLMILNMMDGRSLPVYGDGKNVRDWVYVDDHNEGIWRIITEGMFGSTYNIGGGNERTNIDVVYTLCGQYAEIMGISEKSVLDLIKFVPDRPGHDRRYAIDSTKIRDEIGWNHSKSFETRIRETIAWYIENIDWIEEVKSGNYRKWIEENYNAR